MKQAVLAILTLSFILFVGCVDSPTNGGDVDKSRLTVTDGDGNVYTTVQIGSQVWTVENLRTTRYADGTPIPHVSNNSEWRDLSTPAYCYYGNTTNADSIAKSGALYNYYAVADTNSKSIAPAGWRVPTDGDWDVLRDYLIANGFNWDGTADDNKIGKSMAASSGEWSSNSTQGRVGNEQSSNNSTGFSAFPVGFRLGVGLFLSVGEIGYWWSSSENDASYAYSRHLVYNHEYLRRNYYDKSLGLSVRLVRD